jgi:hypothetical protein
MLTAANKQEKHEFYWDFLQFVQQYPATLDCLWFSDKAHFHFDWFMNKQNTSFWTSEKPHKVMKTLLHPVK